ncbi:MAG: cytochrome c [Hyphomicrobiaceae bacterium]
MPRQTKQHFRFGTLRAVALGLAVAAATLVAVRPATTAEPVTKAAGGPDFWQPGWMQRHMWGPGDMQRGMRQRMMRHWTYMHATIPEAYRGAQSTVQPTPQNVAAGGKLYQTHCASCHGKTGLGDGDVANSLAPSPALLAYMIQRPVAVDEYLLWTISDGGEEFKTQMPAFKSTLKREGIWQIIAYMRSGFPSAVAR